ncbi:isopeptide-forming domain-containing fimbrial protein [Sharpea azabuensis]|uniref:Isopeptide-forming domain-containing fimbrial protein n=1 Tax=Sharpea porci TaxID=2652286 RepID=A0A844FW16_9FIRM|nr:isopeptide-forming domain-containing fimbrial protein [Sharpea porci]MST89530.1 isopeptide-forming domain-containing fimbrial protein [Sharpea porci]
MNLTKKLFSYIVAIAMIFTLTAFAGGAVNAANAKTYQLSLQNKGKTTHTFEVYQIFTGDLSEGILSNVHWGNGVSEEGKTALGDAAKKAEDLAKSTDNSLPVKTFAEDLQKYLQNGTEKEVAANDSAYIEGLAAGYYLVKDKADSQNKTEGAYTSYILKVVKDTTATTKLDIPTVEKKVQDTNDSNGETSGWQDSADYDIGDEIPYQITGSMPANIANYKSYKYIFTDTMSKGLTFNDDATIKIGDTVVTGSFEKSVTEKDDGSTVVTWTCANLKGIEGVTLDANTTVVVNYTAKLNENAVIGSAGNPNTVNLTYSNNPNKGGEGDTGKTPDDKNIVFTYKTVVNKVDQNGKTPLKGAGFTLQKKVNGAYTNVKSLTAGDTTTFEFTGLDDGDYKLIESTTPAGYNRITPIEFTISATHNETSDDPQLLTLSGNKTAGEATFTADKGAGSLTTNVVNKPGSILPETGGMGTTVLYVLGGVLVALAAAYVIYTKKHEKA